MLASLPQLAKVYLLPGRNVDLSKMGPRHQQRLPVDQSMSALLGSIL